MIMGVVIMGRYSFLRKIMRTRIGLMTRPLRLEFAGALYHITSRGDRREDIYDNDQSMGSE